jgi:basic amino acid/polyamine antiporter, APA family
MLMADQKAPQMQATLGLTGLTSNAMALIAPGAFLWLTFFIQATPASPATSPRHVAGHLRRPAALSGHRGCLRRDLQALSRHRLQLLLRRAGLLSKDKAFKYARVAKFIVGWGSHLYYWVYPGVMVATTGIFVGYVVGFLYPNFMSGSNPGPVFMALVAVVFSFFVAWIASKGAGASTAVNLAINVIQISALVVFSVLALGYRASHPAGATGGLPIRRADAGHLHLPVRHGQGRLHGARLQRQPAAAAGQSRQAGSLHHHYPRRTRPATSSPTPTRLR